MTYVRHWKSIGHTHALAWRRLQLRGSQDDSTNPSIKLIPNTVSAPALVPVYGRVGDGFGTGVGVGLVVVVASGTVVVLL